VVFSGVLVFGGSYVTDPDTSGGDSHPIPANGHLTERELGELAALADGTLTGRRRRRVEERVAASPEMLALVEEQRRTIGALRSLDAPAPDRLRRRIEAERRSAARPASRRRFALAGVAVAAVAAAALVAALTLPGGAGGPSVVQAAGLAQRPAETGAPAPDPAEPKLLDARAEGLSFPNWLELFGWRATGVRTDEIEDRDATTVFYEKDGNRIGYTILSGDPIDPPDGARSATREGTPLAYVTEGGRTIVTWERGGRTCVLSGEGVPVGKLLNLAAWKGKGAVAF
jgi:anti-sigma factor RsiW